MNDDSQYWQEIAQHAADHVAANMFPVRRGEHDLAAPKCAPDRRISGRMSPKAVAVFLTLNDVRNGVAITAKAAREAYHLLESQCYVPVERMAVTGGDLHDAASGQRLGRLGDTGWCYGTVNHCVQQFGGKAVYGWCVCRGMFSTGHNKYHDYELDAHAVWERPDGTLCEVTAIGDGFQANGWTVVGFIPHGRVQEHCQTTMNFIDHFGDGRKCLQVERVELREVRL